MATTHEQSRLRKGFTLVEMMVVIFILVILVALAAAVGSYVLEAAAREKTNTTMSLVMNAIEAYANATGMASGKKGYPPDRLPHAGNVYDPDKSCRALVFYLKGSYDSSTSDNTAVYTGSASLDSVNVRDACAKELQALPIDAFTTGANPTLKDGWGTPMRYNATGGAGGRPLLVSAGPDKQFGSDATNASDADKKYWNDNISSDAAQK